MMPNLKAVTNYVDLGCAIGAILDLDREYGTKDECTHETIQMCKRALDGLPVIEAEPVRHGRWEERYVNLGVCAKGIFCSECNFSPFGWVYNYCPNCGADMRGAKDE